MDTKIHLIVDTKAAKASNINITKNGLVQDNNYTCYRPYKQDSTSTKRRLVLGQNQCVGCGTDRTSETIRQGVAESRSYIYTERTHVLIYSCTKYTDVPTY